MSITLDQALAIIEIAIGEYQGDTGPGRWTAMSWNLGHGLQPALVYEYALPPRGEDDDSPLPGPEWECIDAPWKRWGGDAIIAVVERRGLRCRGGMTDRDGSTYQDAAVFLLPQDEDEH